MAQPEVDTQLLPAAASPSLEHITACGDSYILNLYSSTELHVPMMNTTHRQTDSLMSAASWDTVTATMDTALDGHQECARSATVKSLRTDSESQAWLDIMACDAVSEADTAGTVSPMDKHSSSREGRCGVRQQLLTSVADSTQKHKTVLDPATPELAVPLLCLNFPQQTVMAQIFQEAQTSEAPEYLPVSSVHCSVMGSSKATYHSLVAQELTLQENFFTLPVVLLDDSDGCGSDEAQSREEVWQQCMADCRFRQRKTGHLDLYMDWSPSDGNHPCSASFEDFKHQLHKQLQPARLLLPPVAADSSISDSATTAAVISCIVADTPLVPEIGYYAVQQPEQLPRAIRESLVQRQLHQQRARMALKPQANRQPVVGTTSQEASFFSTQLVPGNPSNTSAAERKADGRSGSVAGVQPGLEDSGCKGRVSGNAQATGVFKSQPKKRKIAAAFTQQEASVGNDMAFFLGLQNRATAPAAALGPAAALPDQASPIDLRSDDDEDDHGEVEEEEMALKLPDVQCVTLQLQLQHQRLLHKMQEDHSAVLREADGIDLEVFFGLDCTALPCRVTYGAFGLRCNVFEQP